jgi:hypothetical protein
MTQIQHPHSVWCVHLASQRSKMSQREPRNVTYVQPVTAAQSVRCVAMDLSPLGAKPLAMHVPAVLLAAPVHAARRIRSSACRS